MPHSREVEQFPYGRRVALAAGRPGIVLEPDGRIVEQLVHDAQRECLDCIALCRTEVCKLRLETVEFGLPNAVGLRTQGRNERCSLASGNVEYVALDFLTDDLTHALGLTGTRLQATLGPGAQIVEIKQSNSGQPTDT